MLSSLADDTETLNGWPMVIFSSKALLQSKIGKLNENPQTRFRHSIVTIGV